MRVDPEPRVGELRHVGPPDDDEPRLPQPRHDGRIPFRRRFILEHARARARHLSPHVEQVLHGNRNAGIGRWLGPRCPELVHRVGSEPRRLRIHEGEGRGPLPIGAPDLLKAFFDQGPARRAALGQIPCERLKCCRM